MKPTCVLSAVIALAATPAIAKDTTVDDLFQAGIGEPETKIVEPSCGADTVATVTNKTNDLYVFCVDTDGKTAVMEIMEDRGDKTRLDESMEPADFLRRIVPKDIEIPDDVLNSLIDGRQPTRAEPFRAGRWSAERAASVASNDRATCSTPSLGMSPTVFFNNTTYCGWVNGSSTSANDTDWHAHGASYLSVNGEGSSNHAGPHLPPWEYYYADEDELGDARYGRARVRSCGGSTRLRSWVKASATSGSWSPKWNWVVPSGHIATMAYYANTQHSVWMGYDADDIFFRADAIGSASFGSRFYFMKYGWGENCDMKF